MKIFIDFIKGIIIGIGNIAPGVSGSAIAISMGIYEKLITAVDDFFKKPILAIKSVWKYTVGILIGSAISVLLISKLITNYPVTVSSLFIGLIIGGIPVIISKIDTKNIKVKDIIFFILFMIVTIALPLIFVDSSNIASMQNTIMVLVMGLVAAFSIVVPGVSGSMLLMIFGYYVPLNTSFSEIIVALFGLDFSKILYNVFLLIPFLIGLVVGVILTVKLIKYLIKHYYNTVNFSILGVIVASPFPIILNLDLKNVQLLDTILAIALLLFGIIVSVLLYRIKDKE